MVKRNGWLALLALLCIVDAAFIIGGLASKSSIVLYVESEKDGLKKYALTGLAVLHVVGWTVGPPAWFFFESTILESRLLPTAKNADDPSRKAGLERLKLAQDMGAKVWAAVLVAILFLVPK